MAAFCLQALMVPYLNVVINAAALAGGLMYTQRMDALRMLQLSLFGLLVVYATLRVSVW
jgi:hypothetical protein